MPVPTSLTPKQFEKRFRSADEKPIHIKHLTKDSLARKIAGRVNQDDDSMIRTGSELQALFKELDESVDSDGIPGTLTLRAPEGALTNVGRLVEQYDRVARGKEDLFDRPMLTVQIKDWPASHMTPAALASVRQFPAAVLSIWASHPRDRRHFSPPDPNKGVLFSTKGDFSVRTSGNKTKGTPKSSLKINFKDKNDDLRGMTRLNLKSMWNDPSQMREALAWTMFEAAGVPSSRHTFAKLHMNERYMGLYSLIEQVDKPFLEDHFGKNDEGNLYKAYWPKTDIGPADLTHRRGADGEDAGSQYFKAAEIDNRTYRLKSNEDDPSANNYDDLARLIRTINGVELPGTGKAKFNTDAYSESVEAVLNVKAFLRWAAVNVLIGAWDNYWATPANYYLYNSGKNGNEKGFMDEPFFTFIPWDYDNSLGVDYFGTEWQYADILDWSAATKAYYRGKKTAQLPLIENLLANDDFKRYYLDFVEHMLDTELNPKAIQDRLYGDGGLWGRVLWPAMLESGHEANGQFHLDDGQPAHTGRQFDWGAVKWNGEYQGGMDRGKARIEGIVHYVRMRYDSAKAQLEQLREAYPKGASGATFNGELEPLPESQGSS